QSQSASRIASDMTTAVTPPAGPPPPAPTDITPPSTPTALAASNVAANSITTTWGPSTDNVGVAGYNLFRDGLSAGTTAAPVFTFAGLTCGVDYTLGVEAFDGAGNVSTRSSITAPTAPCPDTAAPTAPTGLAFSGATGSSLVAAWTSSTDNVGVIGYTVFRDGVSIGTTTTTSFSVTGLACGTSYVLDVQAFDAAGNVSALAT